MVLYYAMITKLASNTQAMRVFYSSMLNVGVVTTSQYCRGSGNLQITLTSESTVHKYWLICAQCMGVSAEGLKVNLGNSGVLVLYLPQLN